jgi:hypothetical protein
MTDCGFKELKRKASRLIEEFYLKVEEGKWGEPCILQVHTAPL